MRTKIVRPQSKGMVTIPAEFRTILGITESSLLQAKLTKEGVLFVKMQVPSEEEDLYSNEDIAEWMKEDKLSPAILKKLKILLKK